MDLISKIILPDFLRWVCAECTIHADTIEYQDKTYWIDTDLDILIQHYNDQK